MQLAQGAAVARAPLRRDPFEVFRALQRDAPRSVLLDAPPGAGRWAYMAAGDLEPVEARAAGWAALARALGAPRLRTPGLPPFAGGFVGLLGYDLARELEALPARGPDVLGLPALCGFWVDEVVAADTQERVLVAAAQPRAGEIPRETEARAAALLARAQRPVSPLRPREARARATSDAGEAGYRRMVAAAQEHIAAGDIYQANLAHRLTWTRAGEALALHERLRQVNPSPFAFYLDHGDWQLVSCSPERLLRVQGREVETRPIAGTYPRTGPAEDELQAARLRADPKERAEHTMLVDLERNDVGRVAAFGTVRVAEFMAVERYSHVVHLVSRVAGRLRPGLGPLDAARACFPGGTITGVPKVRAMEIIEALEPSRRGFYTGSFGWIGVDGDADLNIVIRTLLCKGGLAHAPVGAGIVADSDPGREWRETLHKARALLLAAGAEAPA